MTALIIIKLGETGCQEQLSFKLNKMFQFLQIHSCQDKRT